MKGDTQVVVGILLVIVGAVLGYTVAIQEFPNFTGWGDAVATLVAAFLGAASAFALENRRRRRDEIRDQCQSGNRVLLDLHHMWNDMKQYRDRIVSKLNGVPENIQWVVLPASPRTPVRPDFLDASKLDFMLGKTGSHLVAEVAIHRTRADSANYLISAHCKLKTEGLQPKMEAAGLDPTVLISPAIVEKAAGPTLHALLRDHTASIKDHTHRNKLDSARIFKQLRKQLVETYPGESFIDVDAEEFENDAAQPASG